MARQQSNVILRIALVYQSEHDVRVNENVHWFAGLLIFVGVKIFAAKRFVRN